MLRDILNIEFLSEKNFINGEFTRCNSDHFEITNPSTLEKIGLSPISSGDVIESAINSSYEGFLRWSEFSPFERQKIIYKFYESISDNIDLLANILTSEQGKPIEDAKKEIIYGANFIKWFSNQITHITGTISQTYNKNQRILVEYEPIGVVGAITPWNFPSAMVSRKIAPSLAAGCSIIIKPSEYTPFSALALGLLARESGIPAGVINIITANGNEFSDILERSKIVRKLSFTGSTRVGRILYSKSSTSLKKLSLELGGNAPVIICEDADLEKSTSNLLQAKLRSTGQACTSPNRIFVHDSIYNKVIDIIHNKVKDLKIGDGFNKNVNIGPLINKAACEKIIKLLQDATSKGAKILSGGKLAEKYLDKMGNEIKTRNNHNFFEPTIIKDCTTDMDIFRDEIFGPVFAFYKYTDHKDAVEMANDTDYGLSSYIYTESNSLAWELSSKLNFGMVGINEALISNEIGAFAGRKDSGFGIEGSNLGIYEFLNTKYKLFSF